MVARDEGRRASQVALMIKNPPSSAGDIGNAGLTLGLGTSLEKEMATTPVFLPGESHEPEPGGL